MLLFSNPNRPAGQLVAASPPPKPVKLRPLLAFSPSHFPFPLPEKHRFPVSKYQLLRERLLTAGWTVCDATTADWDDVAQVHSAEYLLQLQQSTLDTKAVRELGFPWSDELLIRSLASVGGTVQAAQAALRTKFAANLAGGTHHAFADRGEGFCVLNDVAIAAKKLHDLGEAQNIAVVDLDVHQGNGTAHIAADWRWLTTISVHGARNYPFRKQVSDLDVPLPDQIAGSAYLETLQENVFPFLENLQPDFIFLNAGADVLQGDRYGRLLLSADEIAERDRLVAEFCFRHDVPMVWVMGGGYHPSIEKTVDAHLKSLQAIAAIFNIIT